MYSGRNSSSYEAGKVVAGLFMIFMIFLTLVFAGIRTMSAINFHRHCENYLGRAANAGTIPNAVLNVEKATAYLEKNDLTEGFTSVLYRTPSEDVGYWYKNIVDTTESLKGLSSEAAELEKSNMLMKLREVLTDGDKVCAPMGISIYPYNILMAVFGWFIGLFWAFIIVAGVIKGS